MLLPITRLLEERLLLDFRRRMRLKPNPPYFQTTAGSPGPDSALHCTGVTQQSYPAAKGEEIRPTAAALYHATPIRFIVLFRIGTDTVSVTPQADC